MSYLIFFFIFLFGLIIGSFLNCLIWRIHKSESMGGRSYCPKCNHKIHWHDNIPVMSFLLLKGKCRYCHKPISIQYLIVEFVAGVLFAWAFYRIFGLIDISRVISYELPLINILRLFRDWFIISVMIVIFVYDLRWYIIPDIVSLPAAAVVLILNLILGVSWQILLISGIIGGSFFLIQFVISQGRWIGGGDIRLGLLMGLALGWPGVIVAIFLAYFIGSVASIPLLISGKKGLKSQIPLGIFLTTASIITLFWGEELLVWYLNVFKF